MACNATDASAHAPPARHEHDHTVICVFRPSHNRLRPALDRKPSSERDGPSTTSTEPNGFTRSLLFFQEPLDRGFQQSMRIVPELLKLFSREVFSNDAGVVQPIEEFISLYRLAEDIVQFL